MERGGKSLAHLFTSKGEFLPGLGLRASGLGLRALGLGLRA